VRILHVTDHYLPVLGGIETHVSALADHQSRRGDDVTVLTSTPSSADGSFSSDLGPVSVRRAGSVLEGLRTPFKSFDLVHAHVSVVAPFSSPVTAWCARRGVPTMVTVHSLWSGMGPVPGAAAALSGLRTAPVQWSAVSRLAAGQLSRRLPRGTPVTVLPNAVDVAGRQHSPKRRVDGSLRLVSTMRIARRKRPLQLLRMFDALRRTVDPPLHLTIVGDGPLRPAFERHLDRAGLAGSVTVRGRTHPAGVLQALAECDVYVAPAVLESFGLAALEARCVGLPVVAQARSGMADFITHGVEGLLCDDDADMVLRLRDLVVDPVLRRQMSEHNRLTPSTMTWENSLARHDMAYEALLATSSRRRRTSVTPASEVAP
jgi:glycosyltransferase involved in cell wall biosynthesis